MRPRRAFFCLLCFLCSSFVIAAQNTVLSQLPLLGFTRDTSDRERALERQFDSLIRTDDLRDWMKRLSARPHHLGSAYDKDNAEFMAGLFRSWGFDTAIESFDVLFATPKTRLLEMTAPTRFTAKLDEPALKEDATSGQKSEQLPTYNAYSANGDVTAQLVYANYGTQADYNELERRAIDVRGKIVIVRYGNIFRGVRRRSRSNAALWAASSIPIRVMTAISRVSVYPNGAFRPEDGAQRGSVADLPLYPGDPLTPDVGSINGAKRIDIKDAASLAKIPVLRFPMPMPFHCCER